MSKENWYKRIKQNCENAGTYQDFLIPVIDTLAQILEDRDLARKQFIDEGSHFTVSKHTERTGQTNNVKNPILLLINDLNSQALAYWKELCLTARSYKDFKAENVEQPLSLNDILSNIENGKQA